MTNEETKAFVEEIRISLETMSPRNAGSFRVIGREWSGRLKSFSGASVVALAKRLVLLGFWERLFAYELIACHKEAPQVITRRDVVSLARGMEGWGEVDAFSGYVSGPAWRDRKISDKMVHGWAGSRDSWWRPGRTCKYRSPQQASCRGTPKHGAYSQSLQDACQ